jgi:hypothetical protein
MLTHTQFLLLIALIYAVRAANNIPLAISNVGNCNSNTCQYTMSSLVQFSLFPGNHIEFVNPQNATDILVRINVTSFYLQPKVISEYSAYIPRANINATCICSGTASLIGNICTNQYTAGFPSLDPSIGYLFKSADITTTKCGTGLSYACAGGPIVPEGKIKVAIVSGWDYRVLLSVQDTSGMAQYLDWTADSVRDIKLNQYTIKLMPFNSFPFQLMDTCIVYTPDLFRINVVDSRYCNIRGEFDPRKIGAFQDMMTSSQKTQLSKQLSSAINFHEITGPFLSRCRVQADLSVPDMWSIIRSNEKFIDFKIRPYTISDELADDTFIFGPPPTSYTKHTVANGNTLAIDGYLFLYPQTQSTYQPCNSYYYTTMGFGVSMNYCSAVTNGGPGASSLCQIVNNYLSSVAQVQTNCPSNSIPTATYDPGCVNQHVVCIPWCDFNNVNSMTFEVRQLVNNRCVTYMISKYGVSIISELNTTFIGIIDKEVSTLVQVTGTLLLPISQGRRCSELSNISFNSSSLRILGEVQNKCSDELCSITSPYTESYSVMNYDKTKISIPVLQNYTGDITLSYCCGSDCLRYNVYIFPNNTGGIEYTTITSSFLSGVYTPFKAKNYINAATGMYNLLPEKNKVFMWIGIIIGVVIIIIVVILIYYIATFCYIPLKALSYKAYRSINSLKNSQAGVLKDNNEYVIRRLKYE